ncbi:MAG: phage head closure protein [Kiloniellaceae bacterium]
MALEGRKLGALRRRLVIQAENPDADAGGGQNDPWAGATTVATVWGRIQPLTGSERLRAMRLEGKVSHRITIRYQAGITPKMRMLLGGRVFNIRAVINPEERNRFLELLCEEGVAT